MKRISHTTRIVILLCVLLLVANVTLASVLIIESTSALRTQIEQRMLDISNTAAAMLDGDVLMRLRAEDVGTPEYKQIYRTLSYFYDNIELSYIYCIRDLGGGEFVFTIDSDAESPAAFGESIEYTDALYAASLGSAGVDKEAYADRWGRFYSSYSPVFDSEGRVAGIVAVDFSVEWFEKQIQNQVIATITISATSIIFAIFLVAVVASRFRRRFRFLVDEMNKLTEGIGTLVRELAPAAVLPERSWAPEEPGDDEIEVLSARIRSLEGKLGDQIALVRSQAYVDGLTGLGNRAAYEERVKKLDADIAEGSPVFAVAAFDLNGLKVINDRYGHEKGDEIIIAAAKLIRESFPGLESYRIGGDEFVVIVPEAALETAQAGLARVSASTGVSMAQGLAVCGPQDSSFSEVYNRADVEMYRCKREYYDANPHLRQH